MSNVFFQSLIAKYQENITLHPDQEILWKRKIQDIQKKLDGTKMVESVKQCTCKVKAISRCTKCFQYDYPPKVIEEIERETITDKRKKVYGWTFVRVRVRCEICKQEYEERPAFWPHDHCH